LAQPRLGVAAVHAQDARMRLIALLLLLLPVAAWMPVRAAGDVVIYRCTDHAGRLTLRDTPCGKDQTQQTRTMLRPKDAPPSRVAPPPAAVVAAAAPSRVLLLREPRPLYECIPPEGDPYTSDSPEGHPRWVPLWSLGVPYGGLLLGSSRITRNDGDREHRPRPRPGVYGLAGYGAGTWIRDDCHALPQADVCARLVDRRDEIRRRFFNAMPNERGTLSTEERAINARLDNDCGSH
jgi:hypothetical protein